MLQAKTEAEHRARQFLKQTIADISHQLKTPLAALGLYQEIIAAEPDNADAVRAFAGKAGDALLRMESLIQAMLKITRLDAGSIRFAPAACPLPDLAGRAVRDLLTRAEREGKRIRLEGDPALTLWCDPDWTAEALGQPDQKRPGPHRGGRTGAGDVAAHAGHGAGAGGGQRQRHCAGGHPPHFQAVLPRQVRAGRPRRGAGPAAGQGHCGGPGRRRYGAEHAGPGQRVCGELSRRAGRPYRTVSGVSPHCKLPVVV